MKNWIKVIAASTVAGAIILGSLTACSSIAPPDEVGLYYMEGPSDGYHFSHCYDPGSTTSPEWNNSTVLLPNNLRTWNIAPQSTPGADSNTPTTVNSKPEEGQPSGVQVNLWTQTNFTLNTLCGKDNNDANSPIVQFWEKIGRRYEADTKEGWKVMLSNTIVTALETSSRSVVRGYTADQLVSGLVREEVQTKIAELFQTEIKRVVGGEFFCSPVYDPRSLDKEKNVCGEVKLLLKDVDYANPGIQTARDEKQAAVEKAAAQVAAAQGQAQAAVAEAQGKVDAANKLAELLNNPAWLEYQRILALQACANNQNCTIVNGADGVIVGSR